MCLYCFEILCSILGRLYFANVLANDSLGDYKYVCIANNPVLGAHNQGYDQRVVAVDDDDDDGQATSGGAGVGRFFTSH